MTRGGARTAAAAVALAAGLACVAAAYSSHRAAPPGEDDVRPPDPIVAALDLRSAAKHVIARDVAAGRTPLPLAAALFARLNSLPPSNPDASTVEAIAAHAGLVEGDGRYTPVERLWVQVMVWVYHQVSADRPDRLAEVVGRLREEFRAARLAGGTESLPPVPEELYRDLLDRAAAETARLETGVSS